MRSLRIFWLPMLFVAIGGLVAFACDDPPPDTLDAYQPYGVSTSATDPSDAGIVDATIRAASDAAIDSSVSDAAIDASDDGAADAGPPTNAFTDAGDFTPDSGATTIQPSHDFAGNVPTMNPSKQGCLTCHQTPGAAPAFIYAGSVFADDAGALPAVGVEVSVRDSVGNIALTYSDAYGNFFVETSTVTFPAEVGVRTAANEALMVSVAANGNCNQCHDGATQAFVHVP